MLRRDHRAAAEYERVNCTHVSNFSRPLNGLAHSQNCANFHDFFLCPRSNIMQRFRQKDVSFRALFRHDFITLRIAPDARIRLENRKFLDYRGFPQLWTNETQIFSGRLNIRNEAC